MHILSSNYLIHFADSFFSHNLSNLTLQQKRIAFVASIAFGCLAACYVLIRCCSQGQAERMDEELMDEELLVNAPLSYNTPNIPFYMELFGMQTRGQYIDDSGVIRQGTFDSNTYQHRLNGEGKKIDKFGNSFEGEFEEDQLQEGKAIDAFGNVREGFFSRNVLISGKYYDSHGPITDQPIQDGHGKYINAEGEVREGMFKNGQLNGPGRISDFLGNIWEGDFKDDKLEGQGKRHFPNLMVWEGEFIDGKFTGNGTVSFHGNKPLKEETIIDSEIFKDLILAFEQISHPDQNVINIDLPVIDELLSLSLGNRCDAEQIIKAFFYLNENMAEFKSRLRLVLKTVGLRHSVLFTFAGYIFHSDQAQGFPSLIEEILQIFEKQYNHHRKNGTLKKFFNEALQGFCFGKLAEHVQAYHSSHPIEGEEELPNLDFVVTYTRKSSFQDILLEELKLYKSHQAKLKRVNIYEGMLLPAPKLEDFKKHLMNERKILNEEGRSPTGKIRKFTEKDVDRELHHFKEELALLE